MAVISNVLFPNTYYQLSSWALLVNLLSTLVTLWFGAIRQQTITLASFDSELCHYMTPLGHKMLTDTFMNWTLCIQQIKGSLDCICHNSVNEYHWKAQRNVCFCCIIFISWRTSMALLLSAKCMLLNHSLCWLYCISLQHDGIRTYMNNRPSSMIYIIFSTGDNIWLCLLSCSAW